MATQRRKWLMLFPLGFQRNNLQNSLVMDSNKGKTGEKGCIFSPCSGDETTTYYVRAEFFHGICL